jgi:hypothetical protein
LIGFHSCLRPEAKSIVIVVGFLAHADQDLPGDSTTAELISSTPFRRRPIYVVLVVSLVSAFSDFFQQNETISRCLGIHARLFNRLFCARLCITLLPAIRNLQNPSQIFVRYLLQVIMCFAVLCFAGLLAFAQCLRVDL